MKSLRNRCVTALRMKLLSLASSNDELDDATLLRDVRNAGAEPIGDCADREVVHLLGTLGWVEACPSRESRSLKAEMHDGSGSVTLIWMGRREISGIVAGCAIAVTGRISCRDGNRVIYNPAYELRAHATVA